MRETLSENECLQLKLPNPVPKVPQHSSLETLPDSSVTVICRGIIPDIIDVIESVVCAIC